jgi:signal recognition particle subunit SRP54
MHRNPRDTDPSQREVQTRVIAMDRFDLNEFRTQITNVKNRDSMRDLANPIYGADRLEIDVFSEIEFDREVKLVKGIIGSMTPAERRDPRLIDPSRGRRIAAGSNAEQHDVAKLITGFCAMVQVMREIKRRREDL